MRTFIWLIALLLGQATVYAQPSDAYLKNWLDAEQIPGASMAVVKDTMLVFMRSPGKADIAQNKDMNRHRLLLLSSASNTVTAMAVMQLWEKGLVKLDEDINTYLPFPFTHPYYPNDTITIRRLLTHTAAIEDNWSILIPLFTAGDAGITLDSFVRGYFRPGGSYYSAAGNFSSYQPGTHWRISNMGATLAAYIVERVTGDAYSHYCDTAIFGKLCMNNTSFSLAAIPDTGMIARPYTWKSTGYVDNGLYGFPGYPGLMLRSSGTDMARLMRMYMRYGKHESAKLLDSATVAYMMQPSVWVQAQALLYQGFGFYARVAGNGDTILGQEGFSRGGLAAMYINYKNRTGVLLLANSEGTGNPLLIMDTLYRYGLAKVPGANDTFPNCNEFTAINNVTESETPVAIFPNPTTGKMNVQVPALSRMLLVNMQGQVKSEYQLAEGNNQVALPASIPAGIYFVHILDRDGKMRAARKIVYIE